MYGCGWNKYSQIKDNPDFNEENLHKMTFCYGCEEEEILDVKCGPWSSALICR